ncbi:hypothetical protein ACKKBF_B04450 [Auxenochlorella protothecoides x Auxenochlorella symbiontica]
MAAAAALLAMQRAAWCPQLTARPPQLTDLRRALTPGLGRCWSSEATDGPEGLPLAQVAKACLAGNPRAQLTTVRGEALNAGTEPKVGSCLVHALAPRGLPPLVLLHPALHAEALRDLDLNPTNPASLCYGATDPPGLLQHVRAAGWLPPRLVLLGGLAPVAPSEVAAQVSEARRAWRGTSLLDLLPPESELEHLRGFSLPEPSRCQLVDAAGKQHELAPEAVDAALLDPIAYSQMDLLRMLSEEEGWQAALRLFCAGYLGVEAGPGALAVAADRMGLTVLAREVQAAASGVEPPPEPTGGRWRQFRFAFQRELRGRSDFVRMLESMREEVEAAAADE